MTTMEERAALVALLRAHEPKQWQWLTDCVMAKQSALAICRGDIPPDVDGEQPAALAPVEVRFDSLIQELEAWQANGWQFSTVLDDTYPQNLRTVFNRPPFVFIRGQLRPEDHLAVAVVGTRQASSEGLQRARRLSRELVERGITVVSGLAKGIDTAAHSEALAVGGRTVAIVGTGIDKTYPPENAEMQERIATDGAVVSQFWPGAAPLKWHFPIRNVVTSGISMATVVVEASYTSGARMQARLALEHGRWVFLLQSLVDTHDWAKKFADRPGTTVVKSVSDVIERLDTLNATPPPLAMTAAF